MMAWECVGSVTITDISIIREDINLSRNLYFLFGKQLASQVFSHLKDFSFCTFLSYLSVPSETFISFPFVNTLQWKLLHYTKLQTNIFCAEKTNLVKTRIPEHNYLRVREETFLGRCGTCLARTPRARPD